MPATRRWNARLCGTGIALAIATIRVGSVVPATAADFYDGKKLTIIAGTGAGGGHDIFARMLARHLARHIPGTPTVIVQNMPGAGGTRATEFIYTQAPPDGTMIAGVFPGSIMGPLLEDGATFRFDPIKFAYIGSGDTDTRICATLKTSKIKSFQDLIKSPAVTNPAAFGPAVFGSSAPGGSTHDYAYMAANLAGANIKVVTGYQGTPPITLAMERGEVDGLCGWGWSIFKSERSDWKTDNRFSFIVQMAITPDPELASLGVPDFYSFVSGEKRKAAELIISQQAFSRPYIAPPGTPADRVAILREAFMKTLADPAMIAEFAKINITNKPLSGADLQKRLETLYATPKEVVELARAAQKPRKS